MLWTNNGGILEGQSFADEGFVEYNSSTAIETLVFDGTTACDVGQLDFGKISGTSSPTPEFCTILFFSTGLVGLGVGDTERA